MNEISNNQILLNAMAHPQYFHVSVCVVPKTLSISFAICRINHL